jgi:hypothetical protein
LIHPYTLNHDITEYAHYKQNKFVFDNGWGRSANWSIRTSHCHLAVLSITTNNNFYIMTNAEA